MIRFCTGFLIAALAAFNVTPLMATVIPPIGLAPGSPYQLIFVTTDTIVGSYGTEAPYNAFVNAEAALGVSSGLPSTTWTAITSTADGTKASDNAPWLGLPIYNTQGIQVNLPTQSLYSGSVSSPVRYDQYGLDPQIPSATWTGSTALGEPWVPLGSQGVHSVSDFFALAASNGYFTGSGSAWLEGQFNLFPQYSSFPVYALSSPLGVPEPATLTLFGSALVLLGGRRLLRRRRREFKARAVGRQMASSTKPLRTHTTPRRTYCPMRAKPHLTHNAGPNARLAFLRLGRWHVAAHAIGSIFGPRRRRS
jgi:hypothetical protein